jgi:hypothetical protein
MSFHSDQEDLWHRTVGPKKRIFSAKSIYCGSVNVIKELIIEIRTQFLRDS